MGEPRVAEIENRHSMNVLYSKRGCIACREVRLALFEKGIQIFMITVEGAATSADLLAVNPQRQLPALVGLGSLLYSARVFLDCLGERCSHSPLDPISLARVS